MCFLLIYLQFLKYWVAPTNLISSCFKMLLLVVLKLRNTYILPPVCIYSFQPFIGFRFEGLQWGRYSYCFIRICCCFTVRNHGVLLDHMETPQWGPHGDNFTLVYNERGLIANDDLKMGKVIRFLSLWFVVYYKIHFRVATPHLCRWNISRYSNRQVIQSSL